MEGSSERPTEGPAPPVSDSQGFERALRESESRLRALLHCAGEAIYGVDLRGECTFANRTCADLLGYERPEDLIGYNMHLLIHHTRPDRTPYPLEACRIFEAFQRGQGTHVDDEVLWRRDGSSFPAEYRSYPLWIHGRIDGAVVTFSDISARVRSEAERRALETRMQATQKRESLEVLAGGVAHDFNNLLTVILGNATFASTRLDVPESTRRAFGQIEAAARHGAELAHQMIVFTGKVGAAMRYTDLPVLAEGMQDLLRAAISKRVRLEMQLARDLPKVRVDPTQLRQVLMNLVSNAAQACEPQGGRVVVRTGVERCTAKQLVEVRLGEVLLEGSYVFLETEDDGCGMDAETRARAFDPFFSTKFTGRGLGLAATLGIVRAHGGGIRVESEPGHGTRIRIYFPEAARTERVEEQGSPGTRQGDPTDEVTRGPCVLVVDDEPAVRELAQAVLEDAGFQVRLAGDAEAALELLDRQSEGIAALVLDLTMPGLSSEEALRRLTSRRPDLPVLISSGYPEADVLDRLGTSPIAGFLQKPWDPAVLVQHVRALTER